MSTLVDVTLSGGTGYRDHPPIPRRLTTSFKIWTFDPGEAGGEVRHGHVAEEGANDVVSETIRSHGVWEPPETILILDWAKQNEGAYMVDVGCQLGWFSLCAAVNGINVLAIDANDGALELLGASSLANQVSLAIALHRAMVDADFVVPDVGLPERIGLLKIDVEGNEKHAIEAFAGRIAERLIDRILMEVSPVFNKSYPDILWRLDKAGYEIWVTPEKQHPAANACDTDAWLRTGRPLHTMTKAELTNWVNAQHQFNVWAIAP